MVLNLLDEYATPEELELIKEKNYNFYSLNSRLIAFMALRNNIFIGGEPLRTEAEMQENEELYQQLEMEISETFDELQKIRNQIRDRYISNHKNNKKGLLDDAIKILDALQLEDLKDRFTFKDGDDDPAPDEEKNANKVVVAGDPDKEISDWRLSKTYIKTCIWDQLKGFDQYKMDAEKAEILKLVDNKIMVWGFTPDPENTTDPKEENTPELIPASLSLFNPAESYMIVYRSGLLFDIARMNSKGKQADKLKRNLTLSVDGTRVTIDNFDNIVGAFGIGVHKLLSTAISDIAQKNYYRGNKGIREYKAVIPLKEYAMSLNYDLVERPTSSEVELKKEKKRLKMTMDNAKKAIKGDLEILFNARASWNEKVRGKEIAYSDRRIVIGKGIDRDGYIHIELHPEMAEYLDKLTLTQRPKTLLGIDNRAQNAYIMGVKMADHYNNDNNLAKGTANRLKVTTLLEATSLPTYEKLVEQKDERHWENKIKEPFEANLDTLYQHHVLDDWCYCHSKGIKLTDEEAESIDTYDKFSRLLIEFILSDAPDHTERIARKNERKQKAVEEKEKEKKSEKAKKSPAKKKSSKKSEENV